MRLTLQAPSLGLARAATYVLHMKRVKARKDEVSGISNRGVEAGLRALEKCTVMQGHARFHSKHIVAVGDEVFEGDKIYINVGGRAVMPEIPGFLEVPVLNIHQ